MSSLFDLLDEVDGLPIKNADSAIVGWLAAAHPELLREAIDAVTRYATTKESGS